ncbi:hypothetical protein EJ08DRAFT_693822 [Tothia fuscella]|uniref:Uncharacterized protein n=1 Tax=Tothia fuscella TaxID=1048955 RepID=A0A9P4NZ38_9PEZI|nr:hypothetical protein EJ08DRAFT_693822 [Tothia fuscella]
MCESNNREGQPEATRHTTRKALSVSSHGTACTQQSPKATPGKEDPLVGSASDTTTLNNTISLINAAKYRPFRYPFVYLRSLQNHSKAWLQTHQRVKSDIIQAIEDFKKFRIPDELDEDFRYVLDPTYLDEDTAARWSITDEDDNQASQQQSKYQNISSEALYSALLPRLLPPSPVMVTSRNLYDLLENLDEDFEDEGSPGHDEWTPFSADDDDASNSVPPWRRSTSKLPWKKRSRKQSSPRTTQNTITAPPAVSVPRALQSVRGPIVRYRPGAVLRTNWAEVWVPSRKDGNSNPGDGAWASPHGDMHGKCRYQIVYADLPADQIMKTTQITLHGDSPEVHGPRKNHAVMGPLEEGQMNNTYYKEVIEMEGVFGANPSWLGGMVYQVPSPEVYLSSQVHWTTNAGEPEVPPGTNFGGLSNRDEHEFLRTTLEGDSGITMAFRLVRN